jgi:hypothetical protein
MEKTAFIKMPADIVPAGIHKTYELPCSKATSNQKLKTPLTGCHSALDAEHRGILCFN